MRRRFRASGTPAAPVARAPGGGIGFGLFLLLNAVLFIRPAEIVPAVQAVPLYEILIIACLAFSLPAVLRQLTPWSLAARPITVCVLGVVVAVVLSHLTKGLTWEARMSGFKFCKILLYYLLLVGVVDTPARLRLFLIWLAGTIVVLAGLAVLQYHGLIQLPGVETLKQIDFDARTGEEKVTLRMQSTGIYNDPNDLCTILVVGMAVCLYLLAGRRFSLLGLASFLALGLFGYSIYLTRSRGGFIAMTTCLSVLFYARYGWRRTTALLLIAFPVIFFLFAGRQTTISPTDDTGQARIQLWSEGFDLFRSNPVFGIGEGLYAEKVTQVAHNSFVHAYTELGFLGGTFFLGAFYLPTWGLRQGSSRRSRVRHPELQKLRPYLLGAILGYAAGLLSLSRLDIVPTYMILGLAAVYFRLLKVHDPAQLPRVSVNLLIRLGTVSVFSLLGIYLFIRVFARWS